LALRSVLVWFFHHGDTESRRKPIISQERAFDLAKHLGFSVTPWLRGEEKKGWASCRLSRRCTHRSRTD